MRNLTKKPTSVPEQLATCANPVWTLVKELLTIEAKACFLSSTEIRATCVSHNSTHNLNFQVYAIRMHRIAISSSLARLHKSGLYIM